MTVPGSSYDISFSRHTAALLLAAAIGFWHRLPLDGAQPTHETAPPFSWLWMLKALMGSHRARGEDELDAIQKDTNTTTKRWKYLMCCEGRTTDLQPLLYHTLTNPSPLALKPICWRH